MDELPKKVLYTFYPDRILQFDVIVVKSGTSLPFVRNTINKLFVPEGYVEEISVPKPGQKHDYFRLTDKGRSAVTQIHAEREWIRSRIAQLMTEGMSPGEAAMQAAVESVKMDKLTS